jgi:hypothetical protein
VAWLGVLLAEQLSTPTDLAEVATQREQLRSVALEGSHTARQLAEGHATPAFTHSSANLLADETRGIAQSLASAMYAPGAGVAGSRVAGLALRLDGALGELADVDGRAGAAASAARLEALARELSR